MVKYLAGVFLLIAALPTHYVWGQALDVKNSSGDTLVHVEDNGNVGIGTTNPQVPLHVSVSDYSVPMRITSSHGTIT